MFLFQVKVEKKQYVTEEKQKDAPKPLPATKTNGNEGFMAPEKKNELGKKKPKHETPKGRVDWVQKGAVTP